MARSEIDDIFAAKKSTGKVIAQPVASTSTPTDVTGSKKKKKDKKRKRQAEEAQVPAPDEEKPRKKRVVETVHDTSVTVPSISSSNKSAKSAKVTSTPKPKAAKKEKEILDRFKDSRGTGPRKWRFPYCIYCSYKALGRKTEEGFSIFKETELGIDPEAGGTQCLAFPSIWN